MAQAALIAREVVRVLGGTRILDGISLTAAAGSRIGLIGENGVGKSTLLRLLAGADEPDAGSVERPADLGFLPQEAPYDGSATIADVLDDALRESRLDLLELDRLTQQLADDPSAELLAEYGGRLEQAEHRESWDAERRADLVLDGLGLGELPHERVLGSLSGGQRGRLALGALLVRRPAALVLDEPTNHLDDTVAGFLEGQLKGFRGVLLVASHDRAFLDAVCTDLIDLDPAIDGPIRYGGNYSSYLAAKRSERRRWQQLYVEQQSELDRVRKLALVSPELVEAEGLKRDNEKMGYGHRAGRVQNTVARRTRAALRRVQELERKQVPPPPDTLYFRPPAPAGEPADADEVLISLTGVRVPGRLALDSLTVTSGDRLLVTGPNGAGKSTLFAVLGGSLAADGAIRRRDGLSVGLLAQDTYFEHLDRSAQETYDLALGSEHAEAVPLQSLGLLARHELLKPVGQLSVGQRRRLALALLVANPPELLLLDEPTNHLSPQLCDELEQALASSPGAVVVATHDRWLRSRWPAREVQLTAGRPR